MAMDIFTKLMLQQPQEQYSKQWCRETPCCYDHEHTISQPCLLKKMVCEIKHELVHTSLNDKYELDKLLKKHPCLMSQSSKCDEDIYLDDNDNVGLVKAYSTKYMNCSLAQLLDDNNLSFFEHRCDLDTLLNNIHIFDNEYYCNVTFEQDLSKKDSLLKEFTSLHNKFIKQMKMANGTANQIQKTVSSYKRVSNKLAKAAKEELVKVDTMTNDLVDHVENLQNQAATLNQFVTYSYLIFFSVLLHLIFKSIFQSPLKSAILAGYAYKLYRDNKLLHMACVFFFLVLVHSRKSGRRPLGYKLVDDDIDSDEDYNPLDDEDITDDDMDLDEDYILDHVY